MSEEILNLSSTLTVFLDCQSKRKAGKNIIIAEGAGVKSGILVNSVEDVMDFPEDSIQPPLASLNDKIKQFVIGETEYKDLSVTVLNTKEIFKKVSAN